MIEQYTALYSDLDIQYSQVMSGPYEDLSYRGDDAVVIAGLKDGRISGFWRPMVAFGDDKALKMQIESLWSYSQDIYYQDYLIDGKLSVISQFLLRHGYKARPYYTQVIDTSRPTQILHGELRKSYKSLVHKCRWVDYGDIADYKVLHSLTKSPRYSTRSFQIQQKMIKVGEAECLVDGDGGAIVVYGNEHSAYYAGGKSRPGFNTHALIWQAIIRSEAESFEMGEQVFSGDQKLVNISKFKRGFGGKTVMRLNLTKE